MTEDELSALVKEHRVLADAHEAGQHVAMVSFHRKTADTIESLRADLANCERRAEEAESRNDFYRTILDLPAEDIAEIRDALAKKVKK